VTINKGGTLQLDATAAPVVPTGNIQVNESGVIRATGGITDLTGANVTFQPYQVAQVNGLVAFVLATRPV
jgi:hypothetical protein